MAVARFTALAALASASLALAADPTGSPDVYAWQLPAGFPTPSVPADNPMSAPKVQLGARLFCEPRLSVTGTRSCASCHQPARAFTDGSARSTGATGALTRYSAPPLANVAYLVAYTWNDPTVRTLEQQMRAPLWGEHPLELGLAGREQQLTALLSAEERYRRAFAAAFPDDSAPVSIAHLIQAIAAFERTLISGRSPFDRYVFDDERSALSSSARRGMALFYSPRAGCAQCHSGLNFSGPLRYAGHRPAAAAYANTGLGADPGRFRVPTLRNVALTAPYLHDGSLGSLAAVIDGYDRGARTAGTDPRIHPLHLSALEKSDLLAFLESLTDTPFVQQQRCDQGAAGADSCAPAGACGASLTNRVRSRSR